MRIIFIIIGITLICLSVSGQVTIGSGTAPAKAALLDLKTEDPNANNATSDKGGLLLSRVELQELTSLRPFIADVDLPAEGKAYRAYRL